MAFRPPESILLPARFLTMTGHFIVLLTVIVDMDGVVRGLVDDQRDFSDQKGLLRGFAWTSFFCFILEYCGMLMGVSLFARMANAFYILTHFTGMILTAIFMEKHWSVDAFISLFFIFSLLPSVVEVLLTVTAVRTRLLLF